MDRRGFLRLLGGAVVAAAAPTKAYSFLGGILRPRAVWPAWEWKTPEYMLGRDSWRYAVRITNIDVSTIAAAYHQSGKGEQLERLLGQMVNPPLEWRGFHEET